MNIADARNDERIRLSQANESYVAIGRFLDRGGSAGGIQDETVLLPNLLIVLTSSY